jgi:putative Holliday junction resolvase
LNTESTKDVSDSEFRIPNSEFPPKGRLLGIDYGTVRVGLAVCDADRIIASPLATYLRRSEAADTEYFKRVKINEGVVGVVVGLPISLNGTEGPSAKAARDYGTWLATLTDLPVAYSDERFTSFVAESALLDAGLTNKKRKAKVDRVAAQVMLQAYLDAAKSVAQVAPDR